MYDIYSHLHLDFKTTFNNLLSFRICSATQQWQSRVSLRIHQPITQENALKHFDNMNLFYFILAFSLYCVFRL